MDIWFCLTNIGRLRLPQAHLKGPYLVAISAVFSTFLLSMRYTSTDFGQRRRLEKGIKKEGVGEVENVKPGEKEGRDKWGRKWQKQSAQSGGELFLTRAISSGVRGRRKDRNTSQGMIVLCISTEDSSRATTK